jgi:hypothetical protein
MRAESDQVYGNGMRMAFHRSYERYILFITREASHWDGGIIWVLENILASSGAEAFPVDAIDIEVGKGDMVRLSGLCRNITHSDIPIYTQ